MIEIHDLRPRTRCDADDCDATGPDAALCHVARALALAAGWHTDAARGKDYCPDHVQRHPRTRSIVALGDRP